MMICHHHLTLFLLFSSDYLLLQDDAAGLSKYCGSTLEGDIVTLHGTNLSLTFRTAAAGPARGAGFSLSYNAYDYPCGGIVPGPPSGDIGAIGYYLGANTTVNCTWTIETAEPMTFVFNHISFWPG